MQNNRRQQNKVSKDHKSVTIQQNYEESVLPPAEELAKLITLDANIINWIKDRTDKEQNHRHAVDDSQVHIITKNNKRVFRIELFRIACAFFLLIVLIFLAAYFLYLGKSVQGTIFAGTSVVGIAWAFLKTPKIKEK